FPLIRAAVVYVQSEELTLAEEPIQDPICGGDPIELDGFYEGLEFGRWVIISGERELPGTSGVRFSELAMLLAVTQKTEAVFLKDDRGKVLEKPKFELLPGAKPHTYITLAERLAFCFRRETVRIHGNVVKATHGETRAETLGSGEGSKSLAQFALKQ